MIIQNWDVVEERVRNLVKALDHPLEVYTGASNLMKLPAQPKESTVYLMDRFGRKQSVPRYIWKVFTRKKILFHLPLLITLDFYEWNILKR